jgi:hypothetical protein
MGLLLNGSGTCFPGLQAIMLSLAAQAQSNAVWTGFYVPANVSSFCDRKQLQLPVALLPNVSLLHQ